jgi:glycosyltransferase involved in cell wall biosynthesis
LLVAAEQKLGRAIPFDRLISAADLALFTPSEVTPVLAVLSCVAAGLPVVAPPGPLNRGWLCDGEAAASSPRPSPRLLAQRVLALQADESLQRQIAGRARAELVANSSIARFVESHQAIYQG